MSKSDHLRRAALKLAALALLIAASAAAASAQTGNDPCPRDYAPPDKKDALLMYAFGDSIMWGEGLAERNKFPCRVRNWLERRTGRHVNYRLFAHAGATVGRDPAEVDHFGEWWMTREGGIGEINVSFPTIAEQVDYAAGRYAAEAGEVDLVLVNGCANDVNFRNMLDVWNTAPFIEGLARCKCGAPVEKLLKGIAERFPRARIFVTGYYPLVFKGRTAEEAGGEKISGTAYNLLTRRAINELVEDLAGKQPDCRSLARPPRGKKLPAELKGKENFRRRLEELSRQWYDTSNELLEAAAGSVNPDGGPRRAYFVQLNLPPEFAFSTAHSMLWNFRFNSTGLRGLSKAVAVISEGVRTFDPNDERRGAREEVCDEAVQRLRAVYRERKGDYERRERELKAGGLDDAERKALAEEKKGLKDFKKEVDGFRQPCEYGSLGHPNRYGAALYAQAIISQLQVILPETGWLKPGGARPAGGGDAERR